MLAGATIVLGGALLASSALSAAVDPFYEGLLRQGRLAYEGGDWQAAVTSLRLACFGHLDEPALLTEGLARLAVAQAHSGDEAGFRETFHRIVDVHERFETYSPTAVPADVRTALETAVSASIPPEFLASSPAFSHLVSGGEPAGGDLAALPAKRRRGALVERMESDPDEHRWPLLLAETELELGNLAAAVSAAARALALDPGNQDALCVRGRAQAELGRCPLAVTDLTTCRRIYTDVDTSLAMLRCQVELDRIAEARSLLAALPAELRETRAIRRLARSLPQTLSDAAAAATDADPNPSVSAAHDAGLSAEESETVEQARALLASARTLETLEEALALARPVADRHPAKRAVQHLMAEIAYRASHWSEAVAYFERGGIPRADEPKLLFYLAVAYWESGRRDDASEALRLAQPNLQRSPYVDSWVERILGGRGDDR